MGETCTASQETLQGFDVRVLRTEAVELVVVPELGARVVSLRNLATGREWMWHPPGPLRLFRNRPGDGFETGTLVGWDECLPTIDPGRYAGRELLDHGEVWSVPWQLDEEAWGRSEIAAAVELPRWGLRFERTLRVRAGVVHAAYRLTNTVDRAAEYLWAMHPLLTIEPGDRLELPEASRTAALAAGLPLDLDFGGRHPAMAKVHLPAPGPAGAAVRNVRTGDSLILEWDSSENAMLGVWLTREAWLGYHQLALEPTCGNHDSLAVCGALGGCVGRLAASAVREWSVTLRVEPAPGE